MLAVGMEEPEEIIHLLLSYGADLTMENADGDTALVLARAHDNQRAMEILESAENSREGDEESL